MQPLDPGSFEGWILLYGFTVYIFLTIPQKGIFSPRSRKGRKEIHIKLSVLRVFAVQIIVFVTLTN
jgi:hypothetical protein